MRDQEHLFEAVRELGLGVVAEPALELSEDAVLRVAADRDDEREAELLAVAAVEAVDPLDLVARQSIEPRAALFRSGVPRHRPGLGFLAGEVRVSAQQRELLLASRAP